MNHDTNVRGTVAQPATDDIVRINIRVPKSLRRKIDRIVYERETSKQALIEEFLRRLVAGA